MYLITFHSQFDSNVFRREMRSFGAVQQKPVPRCLSSACGTCCVFAPENPDDAILHMVEMDFEKVYLVYSDGSDGEPEYEMVMEKQ